MCVNLKNSRVKCGSSNKCDNSNVRKVCVNV